jgi:phage gp36-like protein
MSDSLSNLGSQKVTATEETNTTGTLSSILDLSPIDGLNIILANQAAGKVGIPIYAELQDSNGDDLPLDTDLALRYESPQMDQPEVVSEVRANIRPYRTLTLTEQQNEDYRDRVRQELNGPAVVVRDIDSLEVAVESSAQIDWSNSRLSFGRQHVDIRSGE